MQAARGTTQQAEHESSSDVIGRVLNRHGPRVRQHLRTVLQRQRGRRYLDPLLAEYPARGGKLLRPCICMATACALGATAEDALPTAAAIELMHNALLIHDDIEDESDLRRGRPTLHAMHGVPLALNAGDALGLLSIDPLKSNASRLGPALSGRIFEETERMAWATAEGQALELGWQRDARVDVTEEEYLNMVLLKTCWLTTIHPMRVGALIGSRGAMDPDPLIRFGFFVGAAFQIQDDALNLEHAPDYGKEQCGDLVEGKRTLLLMHAMKRADASERERLRSFLRKERRERTEVDVRWVLALVRATGAIAYARQVAAALAGAGLREFDAMFASVSPSEDLAFLRALATWVLERRH